MTEISNYPKCEAFIDKAAGRWWRKDTRMNLYWISVVIADSMPLRDVEASGVDFRAMNGEQIIQRLEKTLATRKRKRGKSRKR